MNMNRQPLYSAICLVAILACGTPLAAIRGNPGANARASSPVADPARVRLPRGALDQILFAQTFDRGVKPGEFRALVQQRAFIWGSSFETVKLGGYGSYYYPSMRDYDKTHTLAWFERNEPDWLAYDNDRAPAHDFEYSWGAYLGLDFSRQDVRDYLLNTYLIPALKQGYPAIAYDNVGIENLHHRAGVYHNGKWVQQYSGEARDPVFAAAVLDYISWVRTQLHARGAALALNATLDPLQPDFTWKLISLADVWCDEGGFSQDSRQGIVDQVWQVKYDLARKKATQGAYVSINTTAGLFSDVSESEITWILANFLLVRGEHSYLAITGNKYTGELLGYPPSFNPPVGRPLEDSHQQGSVYLRNYEHGVVVVNPSSKTSASFTAPAGNWTDSRGSPVSGMIKLKPRSGLILLRVRR